MRIIVVLYIITGSITHLWTIVIAFIESGFVGALLTLAAPFIGEIYWIIKMLGENNLYSIVAIIHITIPVFLVFFSRE
jgi:hypothetical protein